MSTDWPPYCHSGDETMEIVPLHCSLWYVFAADCMIYKDSYNVQKLFYLVDYAAALYRHTTNFMSSFSETWNLRTKAASALHVDCRPNPCTIKFKVHVYQLGTRVLLACRYEVPTFDITVKWYSWLLKFKVKCGDWPFLLYDFLTFGLNLNDGTSDTFNVGLSCRQTCQLLWISKKQKTANSLLRRVARKTVPFYCVVSQLCPRSQY